MRTDIKIITIIIVIIIISFLVWVFWETKPKPGTQLEDLGREHVQVGTEVKYSSNPPTSGPHYEEWIRAGVYDTPRDDRNLVHSLEHGYVIISYNCDFKQSFLFVESTYADEMREASDSSTPQATLSEEFKSESCQNLIRQLTEVYEAKGKRKLIVVPRPNLDAKLALTAWRYLDKLNDFDKSRIEKFIDGHRNQGPEKTIE